MAGMDKVCSLRDAIARDVQNGMSVAMGCGLESLIPFAANHEIVGQKKTDLEIRGVSFCGFVPLYRL